MTARSEPIGGVRPPAEHTGAEQMLSEAARRASRQPSGRLAFVLHLSRLSPPAPRPHHRRIARAILQDVAQRHEGQVFAPRNGDLVLLCRAGSSTSERAGTAPADPAALPAIMARLLARDAPDPGLLVSVWPLDRAAAALAAYAQARLDESGDGVANVADPTVVPGEVDALGGLVATGGIQDMLQRQTAIVLQAPRRSDSAAGGVPGPALRPLYREVSFSIAALEARIRAGGQASADPFLFRHLAGRLDRRMLDVLCHEVGSGGPLDVTSGAPAPGGTVSMSRGPRLHLNLTVPAVLSDGFSMLAQACRDASGALGVEISLMEACADAKGFARARAVVRAAGMVLVLDGISHLTLLLARPERLDADLIKLDWSPRLTELRTTEQRQLAAAVERIGSHRLVLHRAETEAAIRWGVAHGIIRFQGRYVDSMLGASRIVACALSEHCTLRQCVERASATGLGGRVGCGNLRLLDASAPSQGTEVGGGDPGGTGANAHPTRAALPATPVAAQLAPLIAIGSAAAVPAPVVVTLPQAMRGPAALPGPLGMARSGARIGMR